MGWFDFLFRKQRYIESMLLDYVQRCEECVAQFRRAMEIYLETGLGDEFAFMTRQTHKLESQADDLRRQIEYELYSKQLLPESRGDLLGFLENLDRVPNRAETILFVLSSELIVLPPKFHGDFRKLLEATYDAVDTVLRMARRILSKNPELLVMAHAIDVKESECDFLARGMIQKIFSTPELEGFDKLRLRDLVLKVGGVSDLTMDIADRMTIMGLKRVL